MSTFPVQQIEERTPNVNREPPDWIVREIRKVGGMEGARPRFRVVWGGSRWRLAEDGKTLIRPYRVDMWHLEKLHEGEYEHVYRMGECPVGPHRRLKQDPWCKQCFFDGGLPIPIEQSLSLIETVIRLMLRTEELQKTARFAADQRTALFEREAKKAEAGEQAMRDATKDAAPRTVKRSFDTPLRLYAEQALGTRSGLRQLTAREIVRGLRKKGKKA